ncbi:integrator complex subunit 6 homolog, partial [Diachasma alloeum]|uniref:integrator complex subunit 6 homolog n=1 Tax=Diachasma alloeum TaxID=454923 RepID=UPI0007383ADD
MQSLISCSRCLEGRTVVQMRSWLHTQRKKMLINNSSKSSEREQKELSKTYSEPTRSEISSELTSDQGGGECQSSQKEQSSAQEVPSTLKVTNLTLPTSHKQDTEILEALKLYPSTPSSKTIFSKQIPPPPPPPPPPSPPLPPPPPSTPPQSRLNLQENISAIQNDNEDDNDNETGVLIENEREEESSNTPLMNDEIVKHRLMNPSMPAAVTNFQAPQCIIPELQVPAIETTKFQSLPLPPISDNEGNSAMISENIHNSTGKKIVSTLVEIAKTALLTHHVNEDPSTHRSEIKTSQQEYPGAKAPQHPVEALDSKEIEDKESS